VLDLRTQVEECSWRCGGSKGAYGLGGSIGALETFGERALETSCRALTMEPLLDECAYLGA